MQTVIVAFVPGHEDALRGVMGGAPKHQAASADAA